MPAEFAPINTQNPYVQGCAARFHAFLTSDLFLNRSKRNARAKFRYHYVGIALATPTNGASLFEVASFCAAHFLSAVPSLACPRGVHVAAVSFVSVSQ